MEQDNNNNNNNIKNNINNKNIVNKNGGDEINNVSDAKDRKFVDFSPKRSIAERRGFNKINAGLISFGATTPLVSPATRSPCLTIPPGISPTALLESPIMLPNSQAMPSPTTGSFAMLPPLTYKGSMLTSVKHEQENVDVPTAFTSVKHEQKNVDVPTASDFAASFNFKHQANLDADSLSPYFASLNQVSNNRHMMNGGGHRDSQMLAQGQQLLDFSFPQGFSSEYLARNSGVHFYNDVKMVDDMIVNTNNVDIPISRSEEASDESTLPENSIHSEDIGQHHVLEAEQKEMSHAAGAKTSEDGYNWRKYGQKQVKGSEYPRSYYKCTQSNCQVKKKVERSHDGHITEIIYKGNHNHAKPHSSRRGSVPSSDEISENVEANETCDRVDADSVWGNIQSWGKDAKHNPERKPDGQERTSPPSGVTELSDPMKRTRSQGMFESDNAPEHSSALGNHDGDKDGATQAVLSPENNPEDADSESKRRKKESYPVETMVPPRAVREPRVVVQIESDIDILDDGYRWRKYGQKVVKGNPNPRSYYKCTSAGCTVRKHVERASHNLKYVLTTYEGKHNHEVPAARNNNHISSSDVGLSSTCANVIPGSAVIPKSETHQTLPSHFDRKPDFSNDFLRSSLMGNFSNDMKFGPSSISQMNYSSLNNIIPYGAYGTSPDHVAVPQTGPIASMFPEFQMPLPLNLPSSGNYALAGINFNYARPMSSIQSYLSGQQLRDMDTGFLRPKQEVKEESSYAACAPSLDHASTSQTPPYAACAPSLDHASTSHTPPSPSQSIYQCVMQNFPS